MRKMLPVALIVAAGACAGTGQGSETDPTGSVPSSTSTSVPRGETPDRIFQSMLDDLAGRLGTDLGDYVLVRDEEARWNDGSLGCPEPGVVYTQAPVTGYWVVVEVGGREYDYRSDRNGNFSLCESPSPTGVPSG